MGKGHLLSIADGRFVDPQGRHVLLHGINLVNKDQSAGYLGDEGPDEFALLRSWGLNCIRLGVIWDGLEPEPGVYDEAYLEGIDRQVAWASEQGLYVILDMHQDLYSVLYADGAPEWATLTAGKPHVADGAVWSDAYFTSPAVQTALDSFWANALAPDGIGLQEHYARAWARVAWRYAAEPAVVGYDLMNEPFPGTEAGQAMLAMLARGAELLGPILGDALPVEAVAQQWLDEQGRAELLELLRDVGLYAQVVDAAAPLYAEFERTRLMPMYRRVARAIREVDQDHVLLLESTMASNMGVRSRIEPLTVGPEGGERDPLQAYAPHGYDLVTDTAGLARASPERISFIFRRHGETTRRLAMPAVVGEWGAYGRHPGTLAPAWHVVRQFEELLCGETYWTYQPGTEAFPCFPAINRPYPERTAGALERYRYDPEAGILKCAWREDVGVAAPSLVYLPGWFAFDETAVELVPAGQGFGVRAVEPAGSGAYLEIPPSGGAVERRLTVRRE